MAEMQQATSEAQKLVGEVAERIAELEAVAAAPPPPPAQTRKRASLIGLWIATSVLMSMLTFSMAGPAIAERLATRPPPPVARQNAEDALRMLVADIDAFREDYGELPETIHEVGAPRRGSWRYEAFSTTEFRLSGRLQGQDVSFDSSRNTRQ